ncbi:uncharacterized protein LOC126907403 isoform X2 [Daktulosphaira vitifoliae]|uniref:uncharacterized protein LOC126907403 isoform X2 n=1 Tax=Daktulosphaira vitifoliae TaxID=58002 RepID=UPI0021A9B651|nr:uncharacterized protein LOC126907403 isoform X2 [Daktulosphaira vitifoliae]
MPKKKQKSYSARSDNNKKSLEDCLEVIANSEFWTAFLNTLKELLKNLNLSSILCYGLGNFMDSIQSRYQLSLLLLIKKEFNVKNCLIYDPKFTNDEQVYLSENGCKLIEHNEEGKRQLLPGTFIYMPHCPKQLLNNLLWRNWDKHLLMKSMILCNSIDQTVTSNPNRILDNERLEELNNTFWETDIEPIYNNEEIEFITKFECLSFQKQQV